MEYKPGMTLRHVRTSVEVTITEITYADPALYIEPVKVGLSNGYWASPEQLNTNYILVIDKTAEREFFEVWAIGILGDNPTWRESADCELAWQAWQASAAHLRG